MFKLLIEEAEYLVDDKALEKCQGKSLKDQFSIKIYSIRRSLGIEEMQYVNLLVDIIYSYQKVHEQKIAEEIEAEEAEYAAQDEHNGEKPHGEGTTKVNTNGDGTPANGMDPVRSNEGDSEGKDPNVLNLDADLLTQALQEFYHKKEEKQVNDQVIHGAKSRKKSNFESEKDQDDRERKKQEILWSKMTNVLPPQKLSVWRALEKALGKYYQMLVDRQNLIEETGLLNQQNEELKTLLNQYLQAGVNQELQVPPTQVIRLDI